MKSTRVSTSVVAGNFPWVLVKIETDEGVTGLGEAYWGVGAAALVHKAAPGPGMTLNEDVVRANRKPGTSFFVDPPYA